MADIVGGSYESVQAILSSELNMRRVAAKFVPRQHAANDPGVMSGIITEIYGFYAHDPETKQQLSSWQRPLSSRPKKAGQSRSAVESMVVVSRDPPGQTVSREFYCGILKRLAKTIRRMRPICAVRRTAFSSTPVLPVIEHSWFTYFSTSPRVVASATALLAKFSSRELLRFLKGENPA